MQGKKRFWMVWNGHSKTFAPRHMHDSLAAACAEAKRLADTSGGRFFVLEAIGYSEAKITISESTFMETAESI